MLLLMYYCITVLLYIVMYTSVITSCLFFFTHIYASGISTNVTNSGHMHEGRGLMMFVIRIHCISDNAVFRCLDVRYLL